MNKSISKVFAVLALPALAFGASMVQAEDINCDFDRYENGPEVLWGARMGDSPDAFSCSLLNAGFDAPDETILQLEPGASRMTGFLDEIHRWRTVSYPFNALSGKGTTFHWMNQESFRNFRGDNQFPSSILEGIYEDYQAEGRPKTEDHWSEWAQYLQDYYESENERQEYREILHLPEIDPGYPNGYWSSNQCSNIHIVGLPIGNTSWRLQTQFKDVEMGIPLLVDRLEAGEKQHFFGEISGEPVYSSCMLRAMAIRASDNDNVSKERLVGLYDTLRSKVENLFPEASMAEKSQVDDNGSLFFEKDGVMVTFAVDIYNGKPYPKALVFEYTPQSLDEIDQRGPKKLSESGKEKKVVL